MKNIAIVLISLVAVLHTLFLVLEMFLWQHEIGMNVFGNTQQQAKDSAILAMNQGLYNGFLSAGLIWGLVRSRYDILCFFLGCVVLAGVFGAATAKPSILLVQALPAVLALIALKFSKQHFQN